MRTVIHCKVVQCLIVFINSGEGCFCTLYCTLFVLFIFFRGCKGGGKARRMGTKGTRVGSKGPDEMLGGG